MLFLQFLQYKRSWFTCTIAAVLYCFCLLYFCRLLPLTAFTCFCCLLIPADKYVLLLLLATVISAAPASFSCILLLLTHVGASSATASLLLPPPPLLLLLKLHCNHTVLHNAYSVVAIALCSCCFDFYYRYSAVPKFLFIHFLVTKWFKRFLPHTLNNVSSNSF